MTYDSESGEINKSIDNSDTEEEAWKSDCRDLNIIDNLNNSKSNIKDGTLWKWILKQRGRRLL